MIKTYNRKLRKSIREYSKLVVSKLLLPQPGGGDCWYCLMRDGDTKPLGEVTGNKEHLLGHIKEKYVVPSLVYRALESAGCNPQGRGSMWFVCTFNNPILADWQKNQIGKFVNRYLYRQLGLVG